MAYLRNTRHERFAQALAAGENQGDAYVTAGYKRNEGNAGRLNRNEQVVTRVRELQSEGQKRNAVTLQDMTERYNQAISKADKRDADAAVMAGLAGLAKLHGLVVDKSHIEVSELEKMSDEQLRAAIARKVPRLRVVGTGQDGRGTGAAPAKKQAG